MKKHTIGGYHNAGAKQYRKQFSTYEMELQVPYRVRTKIQEESILWRKADRDTRDTAKAVPVERSGGDRGRDMPGSYPYAGKYPAQNERCGIHGVFEREE